MTFLAVQPPFINPEWPTDVVLNNRWLNDFRFHRGGEGRGQDQKHDWATNTNYLFWTDFSCFSFRNLRQVSPFETDSARYAFPTQFAWDFSLIQ